MRLRDRLSYPGAKRRIWAGLLFALALVAFVWPVHARAASGSAWTGATVTLTSVHQATCPWRVQLGAMPNGSQIPPPSNADGGQYLFDSFFTGNCNAARYNRSSQVLLFVILGGLLGLSAARARRQHRQGELIRPYAAIAARW